MRNIFIKNLIGINNMKIIPRKMVHEVLMRQGKYSARYYFFLDSNSETMHDLGRFIGFRYFNCDWEVISMREYLNRRRIKMALCAIFSSRFETDNHLIRHTK